MKCPYTHFMFKDGGFVQTYCNIAGNDWEGGGMHAYLISLISVLKYNWLLNKEIQSVP